MRQGGVLSPALVALYVDDLVSQWKDSGYCIHVGSLFVGCVSVGGLGSTTGSALDSRSEGRGFDSH